MAYEEVGGCRTLCAGFSMENVRFMKPGDSHTQNGLLCAVNAAGIIMPVACVRLCNLANF